MNNNNKRPRFIKVDIDKYVKQKHFDTNEELAWKSVIKWIDVIGLDESIITDASKRVFNIIAHHVFKVSRRKRRRYFNRMKSSFFHNNN